MQVRELAGMIIHGRPAGLEVLDEELRGEVSGRKNIRLRRMFNRQLAEFKRYRHVTRRTLSGGGVEDFQIDHHKMIYVIMARSQQDRSGPSPSNNSRAQLPGGPLTGCHCWHWSCWSTCQKKRRSGPPRQRNQRNQRNQWNKKKRRSRHHPPRTRWRARMGTLPRCVASDYERAGFSSGWLGMMLCVGEGWRSEGSWRAAHAVESGWRASWTSRRSHLQGWGCPAWCPSFFLPPFFRPHRHPCESS